MAPTRARRWRVGMALVLALLLPIGCTEDEPEAPAAPEPLKTTPAAAPGAEGAAPAVVTPEKPAPVEEAAKDAETTSESDTTPSGAPPVATDVAATAVTPATDRDEDHGPAWFAATGRGLVRLERGAFENVLDRPKVFRGITEHPDGGLLVWSYSKLFRIGAGEEEPRPLQPPSPVSLEDVAVGPEGDIWTVGLKKIYHFDGERWTGADISVLSPDAKLFRGVEVDRDGAVWIATAGAIHRREKGATWEPEVVPTGKEQPFYQAIALAPEGDLYALTGDALFRHDHLTDEWTKVPIGDEWTIFGLARLAAGPAGLVAVASTDTVYLVSTKGDRTVRYTSRKGEHFRGNVRALDVDDRGRIWIGTATGLSIITGDGTVVTWPSGSVPELVGEVSAIHVHGEGPALPEIGPVARGAVRGKLIREGEALANAKIEICASPKIAFRESPCAGAPNRDAATTDVKGEFRFEDVPLGAYRFAVHTEAGWKLTIMSCCAEMKPHQVYDAGTIDLSDR